MTHAADENHLAASGAALAAMEDLSDDEVGNSADGVTVGNG